MPRRRSGETKALWLRAFHDRHCFSIATIANDNLQDLKTASRWATLGAAGGLVIGVIFGSLVIPLFSTCSTTRSFRRGPDGEHALPRRRPRHFALAKACSVRHQLELIGWGALLGRTISRRVVAKTQNAAPAVCVAWASTCDGAHLLIPVAPYWALLDKWRRPRNPILPSAWACSLHRPHRRRKFVRLGSLCRCGRGHGHTLAVVGDSFETPGIVFGCCCLRYHHRLYATHAACQVA